ncbi:MAG: D-alanyl-D-alanine carboxypeptidase [Gammaproteobacteria bacterium]|nr:D-alanyl-D-alanine carboxypeptidase [Gammaproteobacteria bacterium]MBU1625598.1 D-alanyl-D-alanine carboxypeptidase [Gammaproteobacteria bacterium]MBU1980858.1 D-alanyl-D-alanine carboxypeptidase [Gammaproteobacteria bacterium]
MRHLIGLWLLCHVTLAAALPDLFPEVASAYLVEIDGKPTWEHKANAHLPPASLTKLMTALLVIEQGDLEQLTTISPAAARETGARIKLKSGERYMLQDLLAATLIASANDACHALADAIAGSEREFVKRMNKRASALGMHDTHFENACGHDAKNHYSSAHDLALLAHEVISHPQLLTFTSRIETGIRSNDGKRDIRFENKNALIGRYRGAFGLKTGYTSRAGKCLIAYAKRGDTRVLLVLLHGNDRWWDAVDILDVAFEHARQSH